MKSMSDRALQLLKEELEEVLEVYPENLGVYLQLSEVEHELHLRELEEFDAERVELLQELERQLEAL